VWHPLPEVVCCHSHEAEQVHSIMMSQCITNDLGCSGVLEISGRLRQLLGDVFTLCVKSKNFRWHISGRHVRDYHRFWWRSSWFWRCSSFSPFLL
jgi:hypothetical protein